jgi:hypothetical protein
MPAEKTLEQLDKLGASSISLLNDFATKGIDFVVEQAPEICSQIINREIYQNIYIMIFWTLISCAFAFLAYLICKEIKNKDDSLYGPLIFFSVASIAIFSIANGICGYKLITVLFSPKVYLIEYFTRLIRGY